MIVMLAFALAAADPPALPEGPALTEAIRARDAELFQLMFLGCDPERLRTMITADIEMYHDRDGVVSRSADGFVEDYRKWCTERQAPDAWRSRRALVPERLNVHPVPGTARSRMASTSSTSARATGPSASSAAPASPNYGP